jgi:flagellar L-ring protein FlgH
VTLVRLVVLVTVVGSLNSCSQSIQKVLEEPTLTPVGSGLSQEPAPPALRGDVPEDEGWVGGNVDYFRDARARQAGDLVTVNIEINDKANFNNTSNRSRKSQAGWKLSFDVGMFNTVGAGKGNIGFGSDSSATGQGSVVRSEKVSIALAAIVREVFPNGHFLIEGSQEILVNSEKRVLRVSGVVDPRNISTGNAISYDRIAEARISYGGSGRVSDVQSPHWAHQLWDKISPF